MRCRDAVMLNLWLIVTTSLGHLETQIDYEFVSLNAELSGCGIQIRKIDFEVFISGFLSLRRNLQLWNEIVPGIEMFEYNVHILFKSCSATYWYGKPEPEIAWFGCKRIRRRTRFQEVQGPCCLLWFHFHFWNEIFKIQLNPFLRLDTMEQSSNQRLSDIADYLSIMD